MCGLYRHQLVPPRPGSAVCPFAGFRDGLRNLLSRTEVYQQNKYAHIIPWGPVHTAIYILSSSPSLDTNCTCYKCMNGEAWELYKHIQTCYFVMASQPLTSNFIDSKTKEDERGREIAFRNIGIRRSRNTSTCRRGKKREQ